MADTSSGVFILNPAARTLDLLDAMNERLSQAHSIVIALLSEGALEKIPPLHTENTLWAVDRLLEQIEALLAVHISRLNKAQRKGS